MSWFEDWFDSPLYEKLYADRDDNEADLLANLIEKELPADQYPKVLDLGCGRGRHSITLARRGYDVTGIDLSKQAVKKAREKASALGLDNLTFHIGDMREPLPFRFDAVLNLFTTFGYFLDDLENAKVLQSVNKMLQTDGMLLIDYLNAQYVENNLVPKESGSYTGVTYEVERFIKNGMVFKNIRFSQGDLTEPIEYQERVKLYGLDWFKTHLRQCGFSLENTYGDYTGSPFNESKSSRLLMIARKTESDNG
ncbi:MAG: class I SAM-dependent methyltransferase [Balneolaceae bacterium]|nr:MAG: class I SAM-dependent methyltransferase [Balneolaceae bacterium]